MSEIDVVRFRHPMELLIGDTDIAICPRKEMWVFRNLCDADAEACGTRYWPAGSGASVDWRGSGR